MEKFLQTIRACLPEPGTQLMDYTFLSPDALWTGEADGRIFAAVAEDRWPSGGGTFLMVRADGPVYVAELDGSGLPSRCAASFPQFMEIMRLCAAAWENSPSPGVLDEAGLAARGEMEQALREKVRQIDPTALGGTESFWSVLLEEFGYGM